MKTTGRAETAREIEISPLTQRQPTESDMAVKECIKRAKTKRKDNEYPKETVNLIESMVERGNMITAYERVKRNKGSAGIDGMTTEELMLYLKKEWAGIRKELLEGEYKPQPVKRVEIPKPNGGVRQLGIPTVVDRLIQQAMYQVLEPIFESGFSELSYGFRKNRSTHDAIRKCKEYVGQGRKYVVDMDIQKFFDKVNHDILLNEIRKKVSDKKMLKLIKSYLKSGVMIGGNFELSVEGTPQGGPVSPLLSNIMLDVLDKELEKRGHTFARYADDCNIYVKSKRAGLRVFESITNFLKKRLKLTVNEGKSSVDIVGRRKFLGYTIQSGRNVRIGVSKESVKRVRSKIKEIFRTKQYLPLETLIMELNKTIIGWIEYFKLADTRRFAEELDGWIRTRLRRKIWKDWKRPWTRTRNLMRAGLSEERAVRSGFNERGIWWNAGAKHMKDAFPNKYFKSMKLVFMIDRLTVT